MNIPKQFIPAIEKGFIEACEKSERCRLHFICMYIQYTRASLFRCLCMCVCLSLCLSVCLSVCAGFMTGHKVVGIRMVLEDGVSHIVDSSELAFRMAALGAMRQFFPQAKPVVLEPVMAVEVVVPQEFQVGCGQGCGYGRCISLQQFGLWVMLTLFHRHRVW